MHLTDAQKLIATRIANEIHWLLPDELHSQIYNLDIVRASRRLACVMTAAFDMALNGTAAIDMLTTDEDDEEYAAALSAAKYARQLITKTVTPDSVEV